MKKPLAFSKRRECSRETNLNIQINFPGCKRYAGGSGRWEQKPPENKSNIHFAIYICER